MDSNTGLRGLRELQGLQGLPGLQGLKGLRGIVLLECYPSTVSMLQNHLSKISRLYSNEFRSIFDEIAPSEFLEWHERIVQVCYRVQSDCVLTVAVGCIRTVPFVGHCWLPDVY